jgi:hypothetical protein
MILHYYKVVVKQGILEHFFLYVFLFVRDLHIIKYTLFRVIKANQ